MVGRHEVLENVFVEMDPVLDGFGGVLVELVGVGGSFVLLKTAAGTGNRLLMFSGEPRSGPRALRGRAAR